MQHNFRIVRYQQFLHIETKREVSTQHHKNDSRSADAVLQNELETANHLLIMT